MDVSQHGGFTSTSLTALQGGAPQAAVPHAHDPGQPGPRAGFPKSIEEGGSLARLMAEGGAAEARLRASLCKRSKDDCDLPSRSPEKESPSKSIAGLIGDTEAGKLDALLGPLQFARRKRAGASPFKPHEIGSNGVPVIHPHRMVMSEHSGEDKIRQILDSLVRKGRHVWAGNWAGELIVAPEVVGTTMVNGQPHEVTLTHPPLVGAGAARMCGEIWLETGKNLCTINNQSGRYSKHGDRTLQHLENAAAIVESKFAKYGIAVQRQYRPMKP